MWRFLDRMSHSSTHCAKPLALQSSGLDSRWKFASLFGALLTDVRSLQLMYLCVASRCRAEHLKWSRHNVLLDLVCSLSPAQTCHVHEAYLADLSYDRARKPAKCCQFRSAEMALQTPSFCIHRSSELTVLCCAFGSCKLKI